VRLEDYSFRSFETNGMGSRGVEIAASVRC
jgi:hypothetical protein